MIGINFSSALSFMPSHWLFSSGKVIAVLLSKLTVLLGVIVIISFIASRIMKRIIH